LCLETSYDNEKVVEMLDDLPPVKPVACSDACADKENK
jgi:hypothetical protein